MIRQHNFLASEPLHCDEGHGMQLWMFGVFADDILQEDLLCHFLLVLHVVANDDLLEGVCVHYLMAWKGTKEMIALCCN